MLENLCTMVNLIIKKDPKIERIGPATNYETEE